MYCEFVSGQSGETYDEVFYPAETGLYLFNFAEMYGGSSDYVSYITVSGIGHNYYRELSTSLYGENSFPFYLEAGKGYLIEFSADAFYSSASICLTATVVDEFVCVDYSQYNLIYDCQTGTTDIYIMVARDMCLGVIFDESGFTSDDVCIYDYYWDYYYSSYNGETHYFSVYAGEYEIVRLRVTIDQPNTSGYISLTAFENG